MDRFCFARKDKRDIISPPKEILGYGPYRRIQHYGVEIMPFMIRYSLGEFPYVYAHQDTRNGVAYLVIKWQYGFERSDHPSTLVPSSSSA